MRAAVAPGDGLADGRFPFRTVQARDPQRQTPEHRDAPMVVAELIGGTFELRQSWPRGALLQSDVACDPGDRMARSREVAHSRRQVGGLDDHELRFVQPPELSERLGQPVAGVHHEPGKD